MHINLYSYNGEHEVVFKESSLTLVAQLEGTLRAGTSILNPTISLELPFADATVGVLAEGEDVLADSEDVIIFNSEASSVLQFNYAYIPEFHRFYFVTDVQTQITGLYWVSMRVDVLMSHRQNFLQAYAMIERNEFAYNPLLEDNLLPLAFKKEVTENKSLATGAYVNTTFKGVFAEGGNARNMIINTITDYAVSYDVIDKPSYMDNQNFDPVNYSAMGSSAVYAITPSILRNIGYALLHNASTRASFVKSIIAFPFTIPNNEIYDFVYIHVGAYDDVDSAMYDAASQPIKGYITNYASIYRVIADFTIDTAQSFLDYAPYTHYELFIPFYGWKELDYQSVQGHRLIVYYAVNYDDGSATPLARGSVIRISLKSGSARLPAMMPVMMITGVVMAPMPPESWLRGTPMAEVTLLGSRETVSSRSKPTATQNSSTITRLATAPVAMPARMAFQFLDRMLSCSYMGMARHTVAGVISQVRFEAPA